MCCCLCIVLLYVCVVLFCVCVRECVRETASCLVFLSRLLWSLPFGFAGRLIQQAKHPPTHSATIAITQQMGKITPNMMITATMPPDTWLDVEPSKIHSRTKGVFPKGGEGGGRGRGTAEGSMIGMHIRFYAALMPRARI